jgi:prepilin peptidase CpaA
VTTASLLAFDALLVAAAASDVRRYRIPNVLVVALAAAGLVLAFPATPAEALSRAASFAVVSALVGGLWLRGLMGGGDFKLLMACALWIPLGELAPFALALGLASGVQGAAALAWTRLHHGAPVAVAVRTRLPYAVSIGAAGLVWSWLRLRGV